MSELPTRVRRVIEGDKVRFDIDQATDAFPKSGTLVPTISGPVLTVSDGGRTWPDEICLSLPQGNFWFHLETQITYTGQATPEELDYEYVATYGEGHYTVTHGEGHPDHA